MFETYRPTGKFGPATIPLWLVALVVAVPLAIIYAILLNVIPLIYVSVLLTLVYGWLLGLIAYYVCKWGHVRNSMIAWLIGLSLPVAFLAAKYLFQWQVWAIDAPNLGFLDHLQERVDVGWEINRRGRANQINGFIVYVVWLIEAGIIFFRSPFRAASQSREPYSDPLKQWASENEQVMVLPISDDEMIDKIQAATTVDQLLEIPIPKSDEATKFAVYNVNSIPGQEMEDAYLSVFLMDLVVGSNGEVEQKLSPLVQNAILTSAQRHQLAENADLLKEAMDDYRRAVEKDFAAETADSLGEEAEAEDV
jgi:hypothetical protein